MATVKDIQKAIFSKLVEDTTLSLDGYSDIRVYLTEEEHDVLASSIHVLSTFIFSRQVCFALLEDSGNYFFISIGIDNELSTAELEACDNRKTLSMAAVASTKIERLLKVPESELVNSIFQDSSTVDVSWDLVESFFPVIMSYEIKSLTGAVSVNSQEALKHFSLYALANSPEVLILPFESSTLQQYVDLLNIGDKNIPEDNLLHSLGSNYWRFCYVDVYRCIERLYELGLVHNFKNSLSSGLAIDDLHAKLKERFLKVGVESHEDKNLEYLVSLLSPTTLAVLNPVRNGMKHDKYIYHLRNIIVHYQKNEAELDAIDDTRWNIIISFLLSAIGELYPMFSAYITALPDE